MPKHERDKKKKKKLLDGKDSPIVSSRGYMWQSEVLCTKILFVIDSSEFVIPEKNLKTTVYCGGGKFIQGKFGFPVL